MSLNYNTLQKYISSSRLTNYELICNGNPDKTLKLYHTNLRLSQAFYPLLSLLEVILRNAINEELSNYFNDPDWLINQQTGFMVHPSLSYRDNRTGQMKHNHFLKKNVSKSILDSGGQASQGKIIADVSFGFWTALFDTTHYRILTGRPIQIFTNLPSGSNRNTIHQKLIKLRDFRNRVYHNEPIIFGKDNLGNPIFDLLSAKEIYVEIQEIFQWLNLDFNHWTKRINNIFFEIERAECVYNSYPSKVYYVRRIGVGIKHYSNKYFKN
ncbi:MAG: Abi family protein [Bacteroidia bacterium]|nr:Abi family protein [Bacteroidia bacterium]